MKTIFITLLALFSILLNAQSKMFVHTTTAESIIDSYSVVDNSLLNGNPDARLIISHVANPNGGILEYNDKTNGVFYADNLEKWVIYNENASSMETGVSFNIYVADEAYSLRHFSTDKFPYTTLEYPYLNGNPEAVAVLTSNYLENLNDNNFQFVYNSTDQKWVIFNEDNTTLMPLNAGFIVAVEGEEGVVSIKHTVTPTNIHPMYDDSTVLNHPLLNDNPNAVFVFSHNWGSTGQTSNVDIDEVLSCWYENSSGRWHIFTEAEIPMPIDAIFNVLIYDSNLGTGEISSNEKTKAYPNPFVNQVNFETKEMITSISVYNLLGQKILNTNGNSTKMAIDLSSHPAGIYIIKIKTQKGIETLKLIKE